MIGNGYWATGITVRYGYSGMSLYGWAAQVDFYDDGFCDDNTDAGAVSTQGTLKTRYLVREGDSADASGLAAAVDAVMRDAGRLGISFPDHAVQPTVYYERDGDDKDCPPLPGWRGMVNEQARRLGWRPMYRDDEAAR